MTTLKTNEGIERIVNKIQYEIQINSAWKEDNVGFAGFTPDGKEIIANILTKFLDTEIQKAREEAVKPYQDGLRKIANSLRAAGFDNTAEIIDHDLAILEAGTPPKQVTGNK